MLARGAGDSVYINSSVARYRGLVTFFVYGSWGSAALHPRLYAVARYRGLGRWSTLRFDHRLLSDSPPG